MRLSRLGNHYVRIRSTLKGAGLHDVNQALRRGSRAMGAEKVTFPGHHRTWDKVADYASTVVEEVANSVGAHPVVNPDATFHSVFGARSISANPPDGRGSPANVETLTDDDVLGANLLFNPVRHLSTSLEEWIRYPAPEVKKERAGRAGLHGRPRGADRQHDGDVHAEVARMAHRRVRGDGRVHRLSPAAVHALGARSAGPRREAREAREERRRLGRRSARTGAGDPRASSKTSATSSLSSARPSSAGRAGNGSSSTRSGAPPGSPRSRTSSIGS